MMGNLGSYMMGGGGMGFIGLLGLVIWFELIVLLALAIIWLSRQINK